ncbi:hypothetical protein GH733_012436 [Mirounga leonina]|nr:hypothetical protein GH733_012436 [Mirounga leonina]
MAACRFMARMKDAGGNWLQDAHTPNSHPDNPWSVWEPRGGADPRRWGAAGTWTGLLVLQLFLVLKLALPRTRGHLPPGPTPLPLLLSKKYGPVFTVYLGPWRRVVVLVGHEAVQEALGGQAEEFSGRGMLATLDGTFDRVFFSNGERWRQLRRFTLLALRDLGTGKREGEELIQAEAQGLVETFQGTEGQQGGDGPLLAQATSNIICSLTFSLRFPYDDEFQTMVPAAGDTMLGVSSLWGQEEQDPSTELTDKNLLITAIYLLFIGMVTVSTTVRYTLLLLLKYPQVQACEGGADPGAGGRPRTGREDRAHLPYTDAVLHKVQRLLALVPMGVPRALSRTTCFRGCTLPQGIEVSPLLSSVLHDPEVFGQPDEFNPDRFLDAGGRFQKQEAFLPFSLGKRVCLGEGLARAELFLLLTTILQAFSLESPCPPGALSIQPAVSGFFNIPPAFHLQVQPH